MGEISDLGRAYLRAYAVDGVSSSGQNKPDKDEGIATFDKIDVDIEALKVQLAAGQKPVYSLDLATTGNITLSGEQTIDGTLTSNSEVLVRAQTDESENGPYVSAAGAWIRMSAFDTGAELFGQSFFINDGSTQEGLTYQLQWTSSTPPVVGTDDLPFAVVNKQNTAKPGALDALRGAAGSVASATDIDIYDVDDGDYVPISGTTDVATLGTAPEGIERTIVAEDGFTLLASANILTPGSVDIAIPAGDSLIVKSKGSGVWTVVAGTPVMSEVNEARGSSATLNARLDAIGTSVPFVDDLAWGVVDNATDRKLLAGFTTDGRLLSRKIDGTLQEGAGSEDTISIPTVDDLAWGVVDNETDRNLLAGFTNRGELVSRSANGTLQYGAGSGGVPQPVEWSNTFDGTDIYVTIAPAVTADSRMHIFGALGQSLTNGTIDTDYYAAATPYNSVAFDATNALMPSPGVLVDTDFTTFTGLLEQKNGNGVTVESHMSEWVKNVLAGWDAAGLTKSPIIACAYAAGGQPIQNLWQGGTNMEAFFNKVQRCVNAAALLGKDCVVDCVTYIQGEANRASNSYMSRWEWARALSQMQMVLEMRIRAITGQAEPVLMMVSVISRNNDPNEISLGAILAGQTNPGRIIPLNPNYALEHYATGAHPSVDGYRRLGCYAAKASLGTVFGLDYRPIFVRRYWMHDSTHMRIEVELPKGSTLTKDTSDDLVQTTGIDNGAGYKFWDKNGTVSISSALVATNHDAAFSQVGTIEVTFGSAPHEGSLRGQYANGAPAGAGTGQGGLGGSVDGPRGLFRADGGPDEMIIPDLTLPVHSWVQPHEIG